MSAKKRQEDDEYEFEMPEFDEEEFIANEKRKAKTYFISFGFGILMAVICHLAWRGIDPGIRWALTFLLAVCAIGFLVKLLQLLDIDLSAFGKKEWFGSLAFYFFTWLAIFILSVNPPFYDASPPEIKSISLPGVQHPGGTVTIAARVTDNVGVSDVAVNVSTGNGTLHPMERANGTYRYGYRCNETGVVQYTVVATDDSGRTQHYPGSLMVTDDVISVELPDQPLDADDEIEIQVPANVSRHTFRVYYTVDGTTVNATRSGEKTVGGTTQLLYTTSPEYRGWRESATSTVTFYVEVIHYFEGVPTPCTHTIEGGTYNISTTADSAIGGTASPTPSGLPGPQPLERVPGFGLLAAAAALAVILFLRRRKRTGR